MKARWGGGGVILIEQLRDQNPINECRFSMDHLAILFVDDYDFVFIQEGRKTVRIFFFCVLYVKKRYNEEDESR